MLYVERLEKIREYITHNKYANIVELSKLFNTSQATIRRCLKTLEDEKFVESVRGGAVLIGDGNTYERPYLIKQQMNVEEKSRIAQKACSLLQSNDSIFLDSSSTIFQMTAFLPSFKNLAVLTNDILIAGQLTQCSNLTVMVTGGILRNGYYTLTGHFAERSIEHTQVDYAFIGVDSINAKGNFMITNSEEIGTKQKASSIASKTVVLCDHEKFNKVSFLNIWEENCVDTIITGRELSDELFQKYTDLGLHITRV